MQEEHADIVISGGGIAGLTAAVAFGAADFRVLCIEPKPPATDIEAKGADLRSTAFLLPSQKLLDEVGIWDRLAPFAAPLETMRLVDLEVAEGSGKVRTMADFSATEIGCETFGWNLPNWILQREILGRIEEMQNVTLLSGISTGKTLFRETEALVTLSDKRRVRTSLVVAADGRNSPLRTAADIDVKTWRYDQKAMVFVVRHDQPHNHVSTEIHFQGGPFTLVPLPDQDGQNFSAIVWMDKGAEILALDGVSDEEFTDRINQRSGGLYGRLEPVGGRAIFPIISQIAGHFAATRLALIAEAAHVVPPIGAQGLNMSLGDIATLVRLAGENRQDLGNWPMLRRYSTERRAFAAQRVRGIDMLNRASMAGSPLMRQLRSQGLEVLHRFDPIRKSLMRAGLGKSA